MAQAVADSSSLIHLERIGQLALLDRLFEQVAIPQAVGDEVKRTLPELPRGSMSTRSALGLEVVGTGATLYLAKTPGLVPAARCWMRCWPQASA